MEQRFNKSFRARDELTYQEVLEKNPLASSFAKKLPEHLYPLETAFARTDPVLLFRRITRWQLVYLGLVSSIVLGFKYLYLTPPFFNRAETAAKEAEIMSKEGQTISQIIQNANKGSPN